MSKLLQNYDTWTTKDRASHLKLAGCPCCEQPKRRLWFKNQDLALYKCQQCQVVYQDPQPDLSSLLDVSYNAEYFASCRQRLPNQTAALTPRLIAIEKLLAPADKNLPFRALDIGSGLGAWLLAAKQQGWQPQGLEPSSYATKFCQEELELNVTHGSLDDDIAWPHKFDVINLNHVLEHFQNPLANLKKIKTLLEPGGILSLEVPRESRLTGQLLHHLSSWRGASQAPRPVFTIVHMTLFSPTSLRSLLERVGFEVEQLWVEGNAATPERFAERFGDSPPLGKLLGRASQFLNADVWAGMGNIAAFARQPKT